MRPHVIALSLFLAPTLAGAHGMRTAYFELTETAPGVLQAELKLPLADPNVTPVLPDGCDGALPPTDLTRSFVVRCDGSLRDRPIALRGLGPVVSDAVVRVAFADGSVASRVLTPERSAWVVPATARPDSRVAAAYVALGFEHILGGADHLLFLLGLLVLVRRPRRVFLTATAFTLSHSVTLAATALHWVSISSQAAEAAIAFSLVLLAADLGRSEKPMHATGMALVFGLVHGFGFAGALAEIGLPDGAVPLALGSFNVGVELGQLAFLCAASLLAALAAHFRLQRPLTHAAALGIGGVGSFWLLERTAVWWL